jgi:hypothetical protein
MSTLVKITDRRSDYYGQLARVIDRFNGEVTVALLNPQRFRYHGERCESIVETFQPADLWEC